MTADQKLDPEAEARIREACGAISTFKPFTSWHPGEVHALLAPFFRGLLKADREARPFRAEHRPQCTKHHCDLTSTITMTFHDGQGYPAWKDQLFVGALAAAQIARLVVTPEGRVTHEERIAIGKRVRDVREGPDGALYIATDEDAGEILRVVPAG